MQSYLHYHLIKLSNMSRNMYFTHTLHKEFSKSTPFFLLILSIFDQLAINKTVYSHTDLVLRVNCETIVGCSGNNLMYLVHLWSIDNQENKMTTQDSAPTPQAEFIQLPNGNFASSNYKFTPINIYHKLSKLISFLYHSPLQLLELTFLVAWKE